MPATKERAHSGAFAASGHAVRCQHTVQTGVPCGGVAPGGRACNTTHMFSRAILAAEAVVYVPLIGTPGLEEVNNGCPWVQQQKFIGTAGQAMTKDGRYNRRLCNGRRNNETCLLPATGSGPTQRECGSRAHVIDQFELYTATDR